VTPPAEGPPLWDGATGDRIAAVIEGWLAARAGVGTAAEHAPGR
jgi:hypothetical protein